VHLTDEGAALLPRVRQALEQLERAVDDVRRDRSAGPLRISTLGSFLQQWLLPRLERFRLACPADRSASAYLQRAGGFRARGFSRRGSLRQRRHYPNLHCEKIIDEWVVPVCTPALYQKFGPLRDAGRPAALPAAAQPERTLDHLAVRRPQQPGGDRLRGAVFDASLAVVRMAVQGAGLVLTRWSLVADEIASGVLVRASDRALRQEESYWLVCPPAGAVAAHGEGFHGLDPARRRDFATPER
jgi:LysR family glycine cleavage system transcriptional activator